MDTTVWDILFNGVRTLEEAYLLDDELRVVEQMSYTSDLTEAGKDKGLLARSKDAVSYKTYTKLQEIEEKKLVVFTNPEELRLFFDQVHKQIMNVPRLQLQLAIEVNEQLLSGFYNFIKGVIKTPIFLEIVVKPSILAGCVVVYKGVYKDYSIRTRLEEHAAEVYGPIMKDLPVGS